MSNGKVTITFSNPRYCLFKGALLPFCFTRASLLFASWSTHSTHLTGSLKNSPRINVKIAGNRFYVCNRKKTLSYYKFKKRFIFLLPVKHHT